jgi:hypothetical protein
MGDCAATEVGLVGVMGLGSGWCDEAVAGASACGGEIGASGCRNVKGEGCRVEGNCNESASSCSRVGNWTDWLRRVRSGACGMNCKRKKVDDGFGFQPNGT